MVNKHNLEGKIVDGSYTVVDKIKGGGFGIVYSAKDPAGNLVALKVIRDEHAKNEASLRKFLAEGKLTKDLLSHKNILPSYGSGFDKDLDVYYMAMELMDHDLNDYLEGRRGINSTKAKRIVISVAEALAYSHGKEVFHYDINPGNILFDQTGEIVKLSDFGIARIMEGSEVYKKIIKGISRGIPKEEVGKEAAFERTLGGVVSQDFRRSVNHLMGTIDYSDPLLWGKLIKGEKTTPEESKLADIFSLGKVAKHLFEVVNDERLKNVVIRDVHTELSARHQSMNELIEAIKGVKDYFQEISKYSGLGKPIEKEQAQKLKSIVKEAYEKDSASRPEYRSLLDSIEREQFRDPTGEHPKFMIDEILGMLGKKISRLRNLDINPLSESEHNKISELTKKPLSVIKIFNDIEDL